MRTFVRLLAVVIAVLFSGCSDSPTPTGNGALPSKNLPDDPDAQWRATYLRDLPHFDGNVTLSFDSTGDRIFGLSGCNEYYAELTHPALGVTTVGRYLGTLRACGGIALDTDEAFRNAIATMRYLEISPERLAIQNSAHQNMVIFRPATGWRGHP